MDVHKELPFGPVFFEEHEGGGVHDTYSVVRRVLVESINNMSMVLVFVHLLAAMVVATWQFMIASRCANRPRLLK